MRKILVTTTLSLFVFYSFAGKISGLITDEKGNSLAYASVFIKGSTQGTTANNAGKYFLNLDPGTYTIICQHVGYTRQEKTLTVTNDDVVLNFELQLQQLTLSEVVVKKGEDPAYEIIRQAIKKRPYYKDQLTDFQCEVYTKGQMKLRDFPAKFLGQKVDFEDGDTSKKKMLYLSETVSTYSVHKPNKVRIDVLSSKVSGQREAYGLSAPQIYSFYENNVNIGSGLNPRGFISPISNGALNFYKYKYEGSFFEDGKEINHIKVIPKRKFEPLFAGYINIVDGDWRIHSVQLYLTRASQMQFLDTLKLDQLYIPFNKDVWVIKSQVIYPAIKILGFDVNGSFVNIYSKFDIAPAFKKGLFNNTVLKYLDSSNKKTADYWEETRPVPLLDEEKKDYEKKDSLELVRKDPKYLDSLDRKRNKITRTGLLFTGLNFSKQKRRENYTIQPLFNAVNFNTVEGLVVNLTGTYAKRLDSNALSRRSIFISPTLRYGFNNHHFNGSLAANYNFGKKYFNSLGISIGKRVLQFNNQSPILPRNNTFSSLEWERNYMKIYEAWIARLSYSKTLDDGFNASASIMYQDRLPLDNTTDYTWRDRKNVTYTPNYPVELTNENIKRHQAFIGSIGVSWQPGNRYVEFPGRKISVGSKYPRLSLSYTKGFNKIFGSDIKYDKWRFNVSDNLNLKLRGSFSYSISVGGFINRDSVTIPDYTHFNGNQIKIAGAYLNSFQLAPYYKYSNTESFYSTLHIEHHFNGFLTNKIPGFRRLNWYLVGGVNSFYVNRNNNYAEVFGGLENIFKLFRVDFIWGFEAGHKPITGFRIGIKGILSGGAE